MHKVSFLSTCELCTQPPSSGNALTCLHASAVADVDTPALCCAAPQNPLLHTSTDPCARHPTRSCNTLELLLLVASIYVECRFLTVFCREAAPHGINHDAQKLLLMVSD